MKSFAQEIKDVLVSQGVGDFPIAVTGWTISIGPQQDAPNSLVNLCDAGGPGGSSFFNPNKSPLLRPRCQVRCRDLSYIDAYNKSEEIKFLLHQHPELFNALSDDWNYLDVHCTMEPMFLYQDNQKRSNWSMHMMAMREALIMPPGAIPSP